MRRILFTILFMTGCAVIGNAQAQDKTIHRSDLPKLVQITADMESKEATIKRYGTEKENGKLVYEVEMMVNGLTRDMLIDRKGNILEIEDEVPMDSLSEAVKAGLTGAAGKGTIIKVVSLTKKGKIVAYEAAVANGKKSSEIQVGPTGKKLSHAE